MQNVGRGVRGCAAPEAVAPLVFQVAPKAGDMVEHQQPHYLWGKMILALSTSEANPLVPSWGIMGFLLILNAILFIAALVSIARNRTHTTGGTVVWALIVLAVPVLGSVLWFLVGRRQTSSSRLRDQAR